MHYSPSLEIVRLDPVRESLTFSAFEGIAGLSFYVFYVNPAEQVRSGEEQIEESRHYLELFLARQIDVLVDALKHSERVFSTLRLPAEAQPTWLAASLNLVVVAGFGGLATLAALTGSWEMTLFSFSLAVLFLLGYFYFALSRRRRSWE